MMITIIPVDRASVQSQHERKIFYVTLYAWPFILSAQSIRIRLTQNTVLVELCERASEQANARALTMWIEYFLGCCNASATAASSSSSSRQIRCAIHRKSEGETLWRSLSLFHLVGALWRAVWMMFECGHRRWLHDTTGTTTTYEPSIVFISLAHTHTPHHSTHDRIEFKFNVLFWGLFSIFITFEVCWCRSTACTRKCGKWKQFRCKKGLPKETKAMQFSTDMNYNWSRKNSWRQKSWPGENQWNKQITKLCNWSEQWRWNNVFLLQKTEFLTFSLHSLVSFSETDGQRIQDVPQLQTFFVAGTRCPFVALKINLKFNDKFQMAVNMTSASILRKFHRQTKNISQLLKKMSWTVGWLMPELFFTTESTESFSSAHPGKPLCHRQYEWVTTARPAKSHSVVLIVLLFDL